MLLYDHLPACLNSDTDAPLEALSDACPRLHECVLYLLGSRPMALKSFLNWDVRVEFVTDFICVEYPDVDAINLPKRGLSTPDREIPAFLK